MWYSKLLNQSVFGFHFLSYHFLSIICLTKICAKIQIDVIQIDIFDLFVNLPVGWAISDSKDQANNLPYVSPDHNNKDDDVISLYNVPIVLLLVYLTRINNQKGKRGSEDAQ